MNMKYLGEVNTLGEAWIKFLKEVNDNGKIDKQLLREEKSVKVRL